MTNILAAVDDTRIWEHWLSMYRVPSLSVALELDLFESLDSLPDSAEGLALRRGFDARALRALLPMLLQEGFLHLHDGLYCLNETARTFLLKSSPFYWGGLYSRMAKTMTAHKLLLETIDNTRATAVKTRAADGWESGHVDNELALEVTAFMHSHSIAAAVGMTHSHDFSRSTRVLDIGGGSGCFSVALAKLRPDIRCSVMELPTICTLAQHYIAREGVSAQVDTLVVDMFRQPWPEGYDTHFLSNIFHDWSPETCIGLAQRSLAALPSGGRILLHEMLLDEGRLTPAPAVVFSLLMAMGTKGQQFTYGQLRDILQEAGFHRIDCRPTHGYYSIVSGEKP